MLGLKLKDHHLDTNHLEGDLVWYFFQLGISYALKLKKQGNYVLYGLNERNGYMNSKKSILFLKEIVKYK